jgi:ubiquinone/menaquinone biosynthesis C-methylase UbiE
VSRYSLTNPGNLLIVQERERLTLELLRVHGFADLSSASLLDVGCGSGHWLRQFIQWGLMPDHAAGLDLLPERIARARQLCPPACDLRQGNATQLPWPDRSFDILLQSTVFSSILDAAMQCAVAAEMRRVVRSDGLILWYDVRYNNPRNRDLRGFSRAAISELFPDSAISLRSLTLLPPLARKLGRSRILFSFLSRVPPLRTHWLGVIQPYARK